MSPYSEIFNSIPEVYKIKIKDISSSLNLPFDDEEFFMDFSVVNDFSLEELSNLLFGTLSWLEHINYKKTLIEGILALKSNELDTLYSKLFLEVKTNSSSSKKITNTEVERIIETDESFAKLKTKIALYKAYLNYLNGVYNILEMLHYAVKHKISLHFSNEKKFGNML